MRYHSLPSVLVYMWLWDVVHCHLCWFVCDYEVSFTALCVGWLIQEELKIQRLRCTLLMEEELETREQELNFKLEHKKELKVSWVHMTVYVWCCVCVWVCVCARVCVCVCACAHAHLDSIISCLWWCHDLLFVVMLRSHVCGDAVICCLRWCHGLFIVWLCVQQLASEAVNESRTNLEEFRNEYDILVAEDKVMDKAFKRDFHDVSAVMADQLYRLFRKRPRCVCVCCCCWLLLNSTILHSRADSLCSCVMCMPAQAHWKLNSLSFPVASEQLPLPLWEDFLKNTALWACLAWLVVSCWKPLAVLSQA